MSPYSGHSFLAIKVDDKTSSICYGIVRVLIFVWPRPPTVIPVDMSSELGKVSHSHEPATSSSLTFAQIPPAFV
ncbi:unnamed protein product [Rhizoctonia solani]|uniref:Uncharacterized protein n=1 Tax=Rhizoctonia solani TaxID=456999 RepID=A0A8H2WBR5_9AGAM|nr:unnamed protein product [Rhizoctonia solani]